MASKKISEFELASAVGSSFIPVSNASGTVTNKVTLQSVANLVQPDVRWNLFLPGAPTNLNATPGNSQISLTWTAPNVLTQTPITDYIVQYISNSGSIWTTFNDGTSASTGVTVTGLTNGTGYVFRVAAINAVGTGSYTNQSSSVTAGSDSYFSNVSLLMHMDGNGNTFADSSSYNHTVSINGDVTQSSTQSKFGGKAAYFDGNNDRLTVPAGSEFAYGTDDFTIEGWFYSDGNSTNWGWGNSYGLLFSQSESSNNYLVIDAGGSADRRLIFYYGQTSIQGPTWPLYTWNHFAVVRSSGIITMYINGVGENPSSVTQNFTNTTFVPTIGGYSHTSTQSFSGYIDEFRITKGVARYTSNFTPPSAAFFDS